MPTIKELKRGDEIMDSNENKSWCEAERMTELEDKIYKRKRKRDKIYKRKRKRLEWKKVGINIKVPICLKCNVPTTLELHRDRTFRYRYYCKSCDFTFDQLELY